MRPARGVTGRTTSLRQARARLRQLADKKRVKVLQGFFRTGPGEYAEGDVFLGVTVPQVRALANEFHGLPFPAIRQLLRSPIHEERLLALLILVHRFAHGDRPSRRRIYDFYLRHTRCIDNWDLVDLTADKIVGAYLEDRSRRPLYRLARSHSLWERRIAVVATFHYIRRGEFNDTLRIARVLLDDEHDLIHKATGWMLREVGKRDRDALERFLAAHHRGMPRTTLRYAIERLPPARRRAYLAGRVSPRGR